MQTGFMPAPRKGLRSSLSRIVVGAFVVVAAAAVTSAPPALAAEDAPSGPTAAAVINPDLHVGWTSDRLRAEFPRLSQRELDRLLFRIADLASRKDLAAEDTPSGPTTAAVINPDLYVGWTRDQLRTEFPRLSQRELDRLLFRIANVAPRKNLARMK